MHIGENEWRKKECSDLENSSMKYEDFFLSPFFFFFFFWETSDCSLWWWSKTSVFLWSFLFILFFSFSFLSPMYNKHQLKIRDLPKIYIRRQNCPVCVFANVRNRKIYKYPRKNQDKARWRLMKKNGHLPARNHRWFSLVLRAVETTSYISYEIAMIVVSMLLLLDIEHEFP